MTYDTPNALRTALEARIGTRARVSGLTVGRLRRRAVLERVLVRLDESTPGRWVLKGGMALELRLPGLLEFAGISTRDVEIVDQRQHFAEKLHALTRSYGGRAGTRSKDLVDMVILIDDGLEPSAELHATVEHVFRERGTHPVPTGLEDPPAAWTEPYASAASDLELSAVNTREAMATLRAFWARTIERPT